MAIPWKWVAFAALATLTAVVLVMMTSGGAAGVVAPSSQPMVSYEELTRIIGPVAI